jgi:ABC-type multidrug transport system fused ATPase/permease subunit
VLTRLSSPALAVVVVAVMFGTTGAGILLGRWLRHRREGIKEPLGVIQAALVGFVALLLAFGLTMAVGRYEARRAALVEEANAIGTTYLRAQTLAEPMRSESLKLLRDYTDQRIELSRSVPDSRKFDRAEQRSTQIQEQLWKLAGDALNRTPTYSAPRLYVETLNETIDDDTARVAALDNRIPAPVLWLQIAASALAVGVLGMYLASHDRGVLMAFLAATLVTVMLLVIFDLDRPHRGTITIPDAVLVQLRESMDRAPVASGPTEGQ